MDKNFFRKQYESKINSDYFSINPNTNDITLQIEVTNACNHKCIFCPNKISTRTRKMMEKQFAKRIIKECSDLGVKKICYHMNGEPLLYPDLVELVKYAKDLKYSYIFITTNGSMASDELLDKLFIAGLDSIKFSINGGSEKSYYEIHGANDFNKVIAAVKHSYEYRQIHDMKYKIFISFVVTKLTVDEVEDFYNYIKEYCDEVLFYHVCHYAGQNIDEVNDLFVDITDKNLPVFDIKHSVPCSVLCNSINVTCEGYLSLCCSEVNNLLIIDDLKNKSVLEAWHGDNINKIRQMHLTKNIANLPCYSCITGKKSKNNDLPINLKLFNGIK